MELAMFKTLDDIDANGKRVLLRGDLNVPMRDGAVSDATRIDRLLPTIKELSESGDKVIVLSHFGRPKGAVVAEMSLAPVAAALKAALPELRVTFASDCVGAAAAAVVDAMAPGDVALLENLRFHPGEEANDPDFARALADLGDVYVNDAFSAAHRAHASTQALAGLLPCAAGRNMQAELEALTAALENPQRPVAAIVGGAKVSSKLDVLGHLVDKVDVLVIGGGMANTFLYAQGHEIGASLCEKDLADTARAILAKAATSGCDIILPEDVVVAREFKAGAASETVAADAAPADQMILDFGPASVAVILSRLENCKTLVWNGPLGAFETPPFDAATVAVAKGAAALSASGGLVSVAGGGDTVAALAQAGVSDDFTYISTAGGAFLEWLEGRELPGVAALEA
ncbi:MAG: phosphoglycerate kinase [Alphaproteobacteria bacterium]|nr:phosphoglycerate kinase [Alphaproteobacteria bacterium]